MSAHIQRRIGIRKPSRRKPTQVQSKGSRASDQNFYSVSKVDYPNGATRLEIPEEGRTWADGDSHICLKLKSIEIRRLQSAEGKVTDPPTEDKIYNREGDLHFDFTTKVGSSYVSESFKTTWKTDLCGVLQRANEYEGKLIYFGRYDGNPLNLTTKIIEDNDQDKDALEFLQEAVEFINRATDFIPVVGSAVKAVLGLASSLAGIVKNGVTNRTELHHQESLMQLVEGEYVLKKIRKVGTGEQEDITVKFTLDILSIPKVEDVKTIIMDGVKLDTGGFGEGVWTLSVGVAGGEPALNVQIPLYTNDHGEQVATTRLNYEKIALYHGEVAYGLKVSTGSSVTKTVDKEKWKAIGDSLSKGGTLLSSLSSINGNGNESEIVSHSSDATEALHTVIGYLFKEKKSSATGFVYLHPNANVRDEVERVTGWKCYDPSLARTVKVTLENGGVKTELLIGALSDGERES